MKPTPEDDVKIFGENESASKRVRASAEPKSVNCVISVKGKWSSSRKKQTPKSSKTSKSSVWRWLSQTSTPAKPVNCELDDKVQIAPADADVNEPNACEPPESPVSEMSNSEALEPQETIEKCEISEVVNCSDPSSGPNVNETFVVKNEIETFHLESTSSSFLEHVVSYANVEGFESTSSSFLDIVNSCAVEPKEANVNVNGVEFNSTTSSFMVNVNQFTKEEEVARLVDRVIKSHCEQEIHNVNELIDLVWAEAKCESGFVENMVRGIEQKFGCDVVKKVWDMLHDVEVCNSHNVKGVKRKCEFVNPASLKKLKQDPSCESPVGLIASQLADVKLDGTFQVRNPSNKVDVLSSSLKKLNLGNGGIHRCELDAKIGVSDPTEAMVNGIVHEDQVSKNIGDIGQSSCVEIIQEKFPEISPKMEILAKHGNLTSNIEICSDPPANEHYSDANVGTVGESGDFTENPISPPSMRNRIFALGGCLDQIHVKNDCFCTPFGPFKTTRKVVGCELLGCSIYEN